MKEKNATFHVSVVGRGVYSLCDDRGSWISGDQKGTPWQWCSPASLCSPSWAPSGPMCPDSFEDGNHGLTELQSMEYEQRLCVVFPVLTRTPFPHLWGVVLSGKLWKPHAGLAEGPPARIPEGSFPWIWTWAQDCYWFQTLFFIPKPLISGRSIVATIQPTLIHLLPQWTVIFLKDLSPCYLKILVNGFSFLGHPSEEIESALLPLKLSLQKLIIYRNRVWYWTFFPHSKFWKYISDRSVFFFF